MSRTVLVISDLHLGGAPDFQMCSPAGRRLLAGFRRPSFLESVIEQSDERGWPVERLLLQAGRLAG